MKYNILDYIYQATKQVFLRFNIFEIIAEQYEDYITVNK